MLCDKISATIGPIVAYNILGYLYLLICLLSSDAKLEWEGLCQTSNASGYSFLNDCF